jgi:hypothetical protein
MSDTVSTTLRNGARGVGAIVFLGLGAVAPLASMAVVASLAPMSSILVIFDVAALFQHGYDFSGDAITSGSLSIGLLLALAQAFYLKTNGPVLYDGLNSNLERFDAAATN